MRPHPHSLSSPLSSSQPATTSFSAVYYSTSSHPTLPLPSQFFFNLSATKVRLRDRQFQELGWEYQGHWGQYHYCWSGHSVGVHVGLPGESSEVQRENELGKQSKTRCACRVEESFRCGGRVLHPNSGECFSWA